MLMLGNFRVRYMIDQTLINRCSLPSDISFAGWRHFADYREISLRSRKCGEISSFVSAKYRSKCREISLELWSELSTKVRENKERNSRNSNPRLLDNTVNGYPCRLWTFCTNDFRDAMSCL